MAIHSGVAVRKIAMTKLLLVGAAFFCAHIPALTADVTPLDRGPPAPGFNWTGIYLGADIGGAWSAIWVNGLETNNDSSVMGGLYAGYNWQFAPRWLIGIESDASWGDVTVPAGSGDLNWIATLRGRVGWIPWDTTMIYFTGGAAWSTVSIPGLDTLPATLTKTGWVVGGGMEWDPWGSNWLFRAEYLNRKLRVPANERSLHLLEDG
jgi:outer membrane immunogenic protein